MYSKKIEEAASKMDREESNLQAHDKPNITHDFNSRKSTS